jgi:hypothetical protein
MVRSFEVTTQSTKLGISADGVIQFRKGFGAASGSEWRTRLQALVDS